MSEEKLRYGSTEDNDVEFDDEVRYSRTVISFEDEGIVIPMSGIEAIEKDMMFHEFPNPHWQFGIVINKGVDRSQKTPKVDISVWYKKEDYRDQRYKNMMEQLEKAGYNVIRV